MFASVRRYTMGAGSIDSLMQRIEEELAAVLGREPGFLSYLAVDAGDGMVETIAIFDDEDSARRSGEHEADHIARTLGEFELTPAGAEGGEVRVLRVSPGALDAASVRASRPVLVAGATGRTGRQIVRRLADRGIPVHALVRDPDKGRRVLPSDVRQFAGDVRRPETLAEPLAGVGAVIVACAGGPEHGNSAELVDYLGTDHLVKASVAAGVDLVVYISSIYVSRPDHYQDVDPQSLGWKARAEEVVRKSGLGYCIIRAGWLTDAPGGDKLAFSQGDIAEGHLSRADLADVCTRALSLEGARGKTFEVVATRGGTGMDMDSAVAGMTPDATTVAQPS